MGEARSEATSRRLLVIALSSMQSSLCSSLPLTNVTNSNACAVKSLGEAQAENGLAVRRYEHSCRDTNNSEVRTSPWPLTFLNDASNGHEQCLA